ERVSRRAAVTTLGVAAAGLALGSRESLGAVALPRAGRFKQSVSRWCYQRIPLDDLCEAAKSFGYKSVELLSEPDWPVVKRHDLECAMANGFGQIPVGFNRPDNHDKLVADGEAMIPKVAAAGIP